MIEEVWDVVVIGGGPAGYTAAIRASQRGFRTLLVERAELGGTCLNRGCIPSKALLHCAKVWQTVQNSALFGVTVTEAQMDWTKMQQWVSRVVQTLRRGLQTLLNHHGVTVVKGEGRLVGTNKVHIALPEGKEQEVTAGAIVLATGSSSLLLPCDPGTPVITEEQALFVPQVPERIVIVGGGASGVELTWLFCALGAKVTLLEMLPRLLPTMDEEVAEGLKHSLERQGVVVRTGAKVRYLSNRQEKATVCLEDGEQIEADLVVCAVGRRANSQGLTEQGILVQPNGAVVVNEWQQTSLPSVFAVGDLVHGSWTAHGGMMEAERAAEGIGYFLSKQSFPSKAPDKVIPNCVYTEPQALSVGLTEQQAREQGYPVLIARFPWRASGAALATGTGEGFVKVIADASTKRVLGLHILGADAVNLSGEATLIVAQQMESECAASFVRQHPSLSEGIGEALWAVLGKPLHLAKRAERGRR